MSVTRAVAILLLASTAHADDILIVMGGGEGRSWRDGGGGLEPIFKTGAESAGRGNTPGGVVEFDPGGRDGWIFPQRVSEELNLSLGILERGGSVTSPTVLGSEIEEQLALMLDDDGATALDRKGETVVAGMLMDFDLGARFGVRGIQFFPRNAHPDFPAPGSPFHEDYLKAFELFLNDGDEDNQIEGKPIWGSFTLRAPNDDAIVDLAIPPQYVRFIRLQSRTPVPFEIAEFRVFGTGFVPTADFISDIFDLGDDLALWGRIRWVAETTGLDGFSGVRVRTRTGNDDTPLVFSRSTIVEGAQVDVPWKEGAVASTDAGEEELDALPLEEARELFASLNPEELEDIALNESDYRGLGPSKGSITDDLSNWSAWSSPYILDQEVTGGSIGDPEVGVRIVSPGPRRYLQFRLEFWSDDLEAATGIGPLAFTVSSPPTASQVLAEIHPRSARLGEPVTFTYSAMPTEIREGVDTGFDRLEIETPVRVEAVEQIVVSFPDGRTETADFSGADLSATPVADAGGAFAIEAVEENRFQVRFPAISEADLGADRLSRVTIRFRARVLRFGTKFSGFASLGSSLGQELIPGNVAEFGEGDDDVVAVGTATQRGLSVDVPITGAGGQLLINVAAEPAVFSPNGDAVNDRTHIGYDLARLVDEAPVAIAVIDLSGRRVRQLLAEPQGGGSFTVPWDGEDDAGVKVAPGIYLVRIELDSDSAAETAVTSVAVAY